MVAGLLQHWYLLVASVAPVFTGLAWLIRRYRRSTGRELQAFRAYVIGNIRLSVGRVFSQVLARQFGMRQYVSRSLATFDQYLHIPSVDRVRLPIDQVYVRLSLDSSAQRRVHDTNLLTSESRAILVFGEPGSGKSSLTKKLFRESCRRAYL